MREYFLAVDGGGSKTEFCLYDCGSDEAHHFLFGSSNYKIAQADAERTVFLEGLHQIYAKMNCGTAEIRGLVMGMSGVDSEEDYDHYLKIALASGIAKEKIYLCNDSELAFFSKGKPPGLCVVAGTGSVATGIDRDRRKARSGGWSNYFSDEGSGGWIGVQILKALLRYCDGYEEYQMIFDVIRRHFKVASFDKLPPTLTNISVQAVAALAKPVTQAADNGDAYCADLVGNAAQHVAEIGLSVCRKLDFEQEDSIDLVMAGSLFKSRRFQQSFREAFLGGMKKDNVRFCGKVSSPVLGGIALAKILFGETDGGIRLSR